MTVDHATRTQFLDDYRRIRHAEGRGSTDPAYYRALPFRDLSGKNSAMWAMRAKTYSFFQRRVLEPIEAHSQRPLDILDLGAGNCWLSNRLSLRGHRVVAVDIFSDPLDGLGAARHYTCPIQTVEADFSGMPFGNTSFDLAIFNASVHYATNYIQTFAEVRRCLRPSGTVVVLDSPIYRETEHGFRMVVEKHAQFLQRYGFPSDALPSREFLDIATLNQLESVLQMRWDILKPWYGFRWYSRPLKAWLKGRRPPSRFWVLKGKFSPQ